MLNNIRTYNYFKNYPIDAFFSLPEIAANSSHSQYVPLMDDLKSISKDELLSFNNKHEGRYKPNSPEDKMRKDYLIEKIQHTLAAERLNYYGLPLDEVPELQTDYFQNLSLDDNLLMSIKHFEFYGSGLIRNNYVFRLAPATHASNSSYWITSVIEHLTNEKEYDFKIRLDPCFKIPYHEYQDISIKMNIYGKQLDWERIKSLKSEDIGRFKSEYVSSRTEFTDYTWRPEKNEVHFTCEELPIKEDLKIRGSRYFHAIFDKQKGTILHCDGAVRIYNAEEFHYRIKYHVSKPEVRKIGKRAKIFQCDDEIMQHDFVLLVNNFMFWNDDVIKYFSL